MANKNISKSIRLDEEVYGYIMDAPGKGFNEKFENIILQAKREEPERKAKLVDLQKSIDEQQRRLYQLIDRNRYLDEYYRLFNHMRITLDKMHEDLKHAVELNESKGD